jgi:hypothetical protein
MQQMQFYMLIAIEITTNKRKKNNNNKKQKQKNTIQPRLLTKAIKASSKSLYLYDESAI